MQPKWKNIASIIIILKIIVTDLLQQTEKLGDFDMKLMILRQRHETWVTKFRFDLRGQAKTGSSSSWKQLLDKNVVAKINLSTTHVDNFF